MSNLAKMVKVEIPSTPTGDNILFPGPDYEIRYVLRDVDKGYHEVTGLDLLTVDCPSVPVPHRIDLIQAIRAAAAKKAGFT